MKEIINIIESTMEHSQQNTGNDQQFQLTMLAIATILISLLEWVY